MNLIECYIAEVHSVKPWQLDGKEYPWSVGREFVEVDVTLDCHGRLERFTMYLSEEDWKSSFTRGYFVR